MTKPAPAPSVSPEERAAIERADAHGGLPCLMCREKAATHGALCGDCWKKLPPSPAPAPAE